MKINLTNWGIRCKCSRLPPNPVLCFLFPASFPRSFRIAEIVVGDETGVITLRARNSQVEFFLKKVQKEEEEEEKPCVIVLRNAGVSMYKGHMRLIVNKWGKISRSLSLLPPLILPSPFLRLNPNYHLLLPAFLFLMIFPSQPLSPTLATRTRLRRRLHLLPTS